jgi:hypothetical protein
MGEFSKHTNEFAVERWIDLIRPQAIKARIIELPPAFRVYLDEDGVLLPRGTERRPMRDNLSDDEDLHEIDMDEQEACSSVDLGDLDERIMAVMEELGGEVFVKLDNLAPTDAAWIINGLKCRSVEDIYTLLKASERIQSNNESDSVANPSSSAVPLKLIIKKWANLHPAMEFRCFIHEGCILGICQRECSSYYDFLDGDGESICCTINDIFTKKLQQPLGILYHRYSLDVYVDKKKRVWVLDVGSFGPPCHPLLFTWEELDELASEAGPDYQCDYRFIPSRTEGRPNPHTAGGGPQEALDIAYGNILPNGFEYSSAANRRVVQLDNSESDSD